MDQLCDLCASIDFRRLLIQHQIDGRSARDYGVQHHSSVRALREAAAAGCRLCSLLLDAFERNALESEAELYGGFRLRAGNRFRHGRYAAPRKICCRLEYVHEYRPIIRVRLAVSARTVHNGCNEGHVDESIPDYQLFRTWIQDCLGSHTNCMKSRDHLPMPTRVVDIGNVPTEGIIRLVEPKGMSDKYVALSHIWGQIAPLTTTRENYAQHLEGPPVSALPATFADTIEVVQNLGFRYVWIDCLCIIQHDEHDWRYESARMAAVYAGAQVTIAAYGAHDATIGLFPCGVAAKACAKGAKLVIPGDTDEPDILAIVMPGSRSQSPAMFPYDTALARRAWAVQESILSPRILGLGPGYCYFECNEVYCDDYLRVPMQPKVAGWGTHYRARITIGGEPTSHQAALESWDAVLVRYSGSWLTEGKDKLPAVSAIASILAIPIGGRYVAGLWLDDLPRGLAWSCQGIYPQDCKPSLRPAKHQPPSWSWAKCDRPVRSGPRTQLRSGILAPWTKPWTLRDLVQDLDQDISPFQDWWVPCLTVHEAEINLVDEEYAFGEVKDGRLVVSGEVSAFGSPETAETYIEHSRLDRIGHANPDEQPAFQDASCYWDAKSSKPIYAGELRSLLLGCHASISYWTIYAMIVQEVAPGSNIFRRLGVMQRGPYCLDDQMFEPLAPHAEYGKITLV